MASIDQTNGQIVTPPAPTLAPVPAPTAATIYSAPNISQAAVAPATPVNPALEEYNAFLNTPELTAARAEVARFQQAINAERQGLRNTTTGLEYQNDKALGTTGASMNLIGRQVGRASQLASDRIAGLGENLSAATALVQGLEQTRKEQFNVYTQEKQRIQQLIAQTGNQAGIKVTDSFEVATEKAFKWEKEQQKKADKKAKEAAEKAEKDELKSLVVQLGGSTKNKKGGSLSAKELKKEYERLSGEKYKKASDREDQEWAMKVANFNKGQVNEKSQNIRELLTVAANQSSGGEEWAKRNASLYGLKESDITPYLKGNWGDGYRNTTEDGASGDVKKLMDTLGVSKETAEKLILAEAGKED